MNNAFEILGIEPSLTIDQDRLNSAFREAGKSLHPDAGGNDGEFASLQQAYDVIASPSKRLRHWLELRGIAVDSRGAIGPGMMDLFSTVGAVTQRAEAHLRKKQGTQSALGLAMLEGESHQCREQLEEINQQIESAIQRECGEFETLESSNSIDVEFAAERVRNLVFLEKRRATMRSQFSRMI